MIQIATRRTTFGICPLCGKSLVLDVNVSSRYKLSRTGFRIKTDGDDKVEMIAKCECGFTQEMKPSFTGMVVPKYYQEDNAKFEVPNSIGRRVQS